MLKKHRPSRAMSHLSGSLVVVVLSLLAMGAATSVALFLQPWEDAASDLLMRLRYRLAPHLRDRTGGQITLLAIDAVTLDRFGRYGAGQWITRTPFLNQLGFLAEYGRPSVLGYDVIFQEGGGTADSPVSRSAGAMRDIVRAVTLVAEGESEAMPVQTLADMTRLTIEQGDLFLAHCLAAVREDDRFRVVLGYNLRGGMDRQATRIPEWSRQDIVGDDAGGNENCGFRVPYLNDIAIPPADIHFPSSEAACAYPFSSNANLPSRNLLDYSMLGFLNGRPDADSVRRRIPLVLGYRYRNPVSREETRRFVPSFSLIVCMTHLGIRFPLKPGDVEVYFGDEIVVRTPRHGVYRIPIDEQGQLHLNFTARFEDYPAISFGEASPDANASQAWRARQAARYARFLRDRIVLVGITATGIDVGSCPLDAVTPLVLMHMTAANNILGRCFIAPLGRDARRIALAVLFLAFTSLWLMERTARLGPASLLCGVLYLVAAYASIHESLAILPLMAPVLYVGLGTLSVLSYRFLTQERERRRIRNMFSTMVSDQVLRYLEENPDSFSLRGQSVEATVFFSDIASFTAIGESLQPDKLIELLNSYLTPITDCIMRNKGYVDKYVGDLVMAVWGAPYPNPEHAVDACLCALEQQQILAELNETRFRRLGLQIRVRMGINSGVVTAGNMGSERKLQYTVIGDAVNVASRLEPANKEFGTDIIIGETTWRMAGERMVVRPLGRVLAPGKGEPLTIYELLGERGHVPANRIEAARLYAEALDRFQQRDWSACACLCEKALGVVVDPPSQMLLDRARRCQAGNMGTTQEDGSVRTGKG